MKLADTIKTDHAFLALDSRKAVAFALIIDELDAIKSGDDPYPAHWQRIIDIARQEVGIPSRA